MAAVSENNRFSLRRLMPLGLIAVVAVAGYVFLGDFLSFETLRDNRDGLIAFRDQHYFSLVMLFLGAYVVIVGFSLPGGAVASITGGFLFGVFPGVAFNVVGATLGALVIFSAARYGLGEALSRRMEASEGAVRQIRDGLKENEISFLFLMRLVPAVPFFAANLVPALVGVSTFRFAITTFIGIIPGALVFTWIGAGLGGVFERGETPDLGIIFEPQILGPILGLCALAALPVLIKAIRKGKS